MMAAVGIKTIRKIGIQDCGEEEKVTLQYQTVKILILCVFVMEEQLDIFSNYQSYSIYITKPRCKISKNDLI